MRTHEFSRNILETIIFALDCEFRHLTIVMYTDRTVFHIEWRGRKKFDLPNHAQGP